jgi:glycine betaine catabolism B
MEINGMEQDLAKMMELAVTREQQIASASSRLEMADPVNILTRQLHPEKISLLLQSIKEETPTTRTFRFTAAAGQSLPLFRPGQYLSVKMEVEGKRVTRPYSISSAPADLPGFLELTVRRKENGFVSEQIWRCWREGTLVEASGPHGTFYFDPLRDSRKIVGIAGGSGVTPFRSMIKEIATGKLGVELLLLYGSRREEEIIFAGELAALAGKAPQKIQVVPLISEPGARWHGLKGFIDAVVIREFAGELKEKSFFVCGPPAMYRFAAEQLAALGIVRRQVRWELAGAVEDITAEPGYPLEARGRTFQLSVYIGGAEKTLPAAAEESILTALERAGLATDSQCRSGECGFCRSLLQSGQVYCRPEGDGRRAADRKLGFIHPCAAYPLSDLELWVP